MSSKTITVVGPLKSESEAKETAKSLGAENHSVYSRSVKDAEGYDTNERQWFVERDESVIPKTIFGYKAQEFMSRQYR